MRGVLPCRRADLLVVAIGSPEMVKADWVKPGAVVVDVGINVEEDDNGKSRVLGDVAFEEVSQVAGQPPHSLDLSLHSQSQTPAKQFLSCRTSCHLIS